MKRILAALFALSLLTATPAKAQTVLSGTGAGCTIAAPGVGCDFESLTGAGTVGIQVVGASISGTVSFAVSNDDVTFTALTCYPPNSTTGVTSTTAAGIWSCPSAGFKRLKVYFSSYTSGTATIYASTAQARGANVPSTSALVAGGTCTNGVATGISTAGAPTCSTGPTVTGTVTAGAFTTSGALGAGAATVTSLSAGSGAISTSGTLGGGAATVTSLSAGSGAISTSGTLGGGAATVTSLNAGSGTIQTTGSVTYGTASGTSETIKAGGSSDSVTVGGLLATARTTTDNATTNTWNVVSIPISANTLNANGKTLEFKVGLLGANNTNTHEYEAYFSLASATCSGTGAAVCNSGCIIEASVTNTAAFNAEVMTVLITRTSAGNQDYARQLSGGGNTAMTTGTCTIDETAASKFVFATRNTTTNAASLAQVSAWAWIW